MAEAFELVRADLARVEEGLARESRSGIAPVAEIADYLLSAGGKRLRPALHLLAAKFCGYKGPSAIQAITLLPHSIQFSDNIEEAVTGADAVVLLTEWNQYRGLDLEKIRLAMSGDVFIDLRNVYERDLIQKHGFIYTCVGR